MLLTLGTSIFVRLWFSSEVLLHSHTPIQYGNFCMHIPVIFMSDSLISLSSWLCVVYLFASTFCYTYDMKRALFRFWFRFLLQRTLPPAHTTTYPQVHPCPRVHSYLAFWLAHSTISLVNRPLSFLCSRCSSLSHLFMIESSPAFILRKVSRPFILAWDCCG